MATKIVGFDSDYDETSKLVANWRRDNIYNKFISDGHGVEILKGNLATRPYLSKELVKNGVTFLSASGHGLYNEFQGSDGSAALSIGIYNKDEVKDKIIHLLSCNTGFELGPDVVTNGCRSFFGYDVPFTFFKDHMDVLMAPDAELDFALSKGSSAKDAHDLMIKLYEEKIEHLQENGAFDHAAAMEVNMEHLCTSVKHSQWGDSTAKI